MLNLVAQVYVEFLAAVVRVVTGRLYTEEQIRTITSGTLGKYFAEFFPAPEDDREAKERVDAARRHIEAAGAIIRDMQQDLEAQDQELSTLLEEVEQKRQLADRYQALAETNGIVFQAFKIEMEHALRKELQEQAEKGRRIRQLVSLAVWVITLFAGAALGAYFKEMVAWLQML